MRTDGSPLVKIGYTGDPPTRLQAARTFAPGMQYHCAFWVASDCKLAEQQVHILLESHKVNNHPTGAQEWFNCSFAKGLMARNHVVTALRAACK